MPEPTFSNEEDIGLVVLREIESYIQQGFENLDAVERFKMFISVLSANEHLPTTKIIENAIALCIEKKNEISNSEVILDFLRAYRISRISSRRIGIKQQIHDASKGKLKLNSKELNEVGLTQNRARGKVFEQMGLVLVQYYLHELEKIEGTTNILIDQVEFECVNYKGEKTKRRYDLYLPDHQIGVEIKSGRIIYSPGIRNQVSKDYYLLQNGDVKNVWWFLFYGGSAKVLKELSRCKITYIDFGFNDNEQNFPKTRSY